MKIQTTIVIGLSLFALAVAGANASGVRSVYHSNSALATLGQGSHSQTATARARAKAAALAKKLKAEAVALAKLKAEAAAASMAPGGPRYIYIPPPANPTVYVDPNECQDNGTNCDNLQACEFWGENCGSIPSYCLQAYANTPAADGSTDPASTDGSAPNDGSTIGTSDGC